MTRVAYPMPFHRLRDEMDRLFGSVLENAWATPFAPGQAAFPAVNIWESDSGYHLEAELPGLTMEDLHISLTGNELSLSGERKPETTDDKSVYHRRERGFGKFARLVRLPTDVDADRVEATLKDGVLNLTLPKAAAARPRKIEVKFA